MPTVQTQPQAKAPRNLFHNDHNQKSAFSPKANDFHSQTAPQLHSQTAPQPHSPTASQLSPFYKQKPRPRS